jgi:hypothetical protein
MKILLTLLLFFSLGFVKAQMSTPINTMALNGTWDLFENSTGTTSKTPDQSMNIMTFDQNRIVVQGITAGDTYWIGLGELKGSEGYFDWRFNDGRYGQTTFKIDKNGNMDALSLSFTVNYKYLAKKRND